jgi:hypothetical protein
MNMAKLYGSGEGMPYGSTNAAEFVLVRLKTAGDSRLLVTPQGDQGGHAEIPKEAVPLNVEASGPRAFSVHPKTPLTPGEYAFYWNSGGRGFGGQIWDFGIDSK